MKLSTTIVILSSVLPAVFADFHINHIFSTVASSPTGQTNWDEYLACPSNYYKCDCMTNHDRAGIIQNGGEDFMSIENFCGVPKMNLYKNGDIYGIYIDGGDDTQIGTCYWNNDEKKTCGIVGGSSSTSGGYVCYSYVCGR